MRPIDADALISKLAYHRDGLDHSNVTAVSVLNNVIEIIERRPAVSPDEVRGVGKWIEPYFIECSICHAEFDSEVTCSEIYGWPWLFCPKCGAKMEVSEDD